MGTRQRIVESAEVLFAQHGYAGTSLREITEDAQVNIAAVNYHFGSKEALLGSVLDRIVKPITEERLSRLDALESAGMPTVRQILTAFLEPDLIAISELRGRHPDLPRFVSRMYSENSDVMSEIMGRQFAETQHRFHAAFGKVLPGLTDDELGWRLHCIVAIILYLFAGVTSDNTPEMLKDDIEIDLHRLLAVAEPIMTADSEVTATR